MALVQHECGLEHGLVLSGLLASLDYVVLARCACVCRGWRYLVAQELGPGPENSLQTRYSVLASAFTEALPATMRTMYRANIYTAGLSPLQADLMMPMAVQHVVEGLEAHLHDRPADIYIYMYIYIYVYIYVYTYIYIHIHI